MQISLRRRANRSARRGSRFSDRDAGPARRPGGFGLRRSGVCWLGPRLASSTSFFPSRAVGRGAARPSCWGRRRRGAGAAAFLPASGPARAFAACSLHASGARPAPEPPQSGASPQQRQHHQRQPPEPPQRGRGALGVPAAASRRQLPGLDRQELLRGDEPQRALDAGAVLAQALLEPRQAQSLQPDLGSALRLRHGEPGPPCPAPSPGPAAPVPSPDGARWEAGAGRGPEGGGGSAGRRWKGGRRHSAEASGRPGVTGVAR